MGSEKSSGPEDSGTGAELRLAKSRFRSGIASQVSVALLGRLENVEIAIRSPVPASLL